MNVAATHDLDELLTAMINSATGISDLLFVTDKPPQVDVHGTLETPVAEWPVLTGERIEGLCGAVLRDNAKLLHDLAKTGSCDCSYALADLCRFRVNIYRQNGNYAMAMRRLPSKIPSIESLGLPPLTHEIVKEPNGLVFVTGGTGNGKTTSLAALLHEINHTRKIHVISLEDPIEYLHPQAKSTFSQREMGRDFFTFPDGFRAALRQAPKVILVGEIRDRETMEIALTAGETGHLVLTTLHTNSADQTIHRILGLFHQHEEQLVRERLAGSLRYILGQRLVPKKGGGRHLVTELMGSSLRTREAIENGENDNRRLHDIIEAGSTMGWHSFEQSLLKAFENDLITEETAIQYSIHKPGMRQRLDASHARNHIPRAQIAAAAPMIMVGAAKPEPEPAPALGLASAPPPAPKSQPGRFRSILHGNM